MAGEAIEAAGRDMHALMAELYPLCRSITGEGLRETLRRIRRRIPIEIREVPSGTRMFDWTVPMEWNIRDAYVKDPDGRKVIDFQQCNLHVVGYSVPVRASLSLDELKSHLHTLPDRPDWIPFRTSYAGESWGFCLSHRQLLALKDGRYEVVIDSTLGAGSLSYGELLIPGRTQEEVLISAHACHPSLCNDNLSGVALATKLAEILAGRSSRYSYRFLFIPATYGSIAWLASNRATVGRIRHGLVLACVGDAGHVTYKRSRRGNAEIDEAMQYVLGQANDGSTVIDFIPYGYDERQYCSPGFDLPVGCFSRTPHGQFPEYHTSADNPGFVTAAALGHSFATCLSAIEILEHNRRYRNLNPFCEPQLGRRGIYRSWAEQTEGGRRELALLWVLNLSDGTNSTLDIAKRSGMPFDLIQTAADVLREQGLLQEVAAEHDSAREDPPRCN